jgi:protein unc-13 A/B/C
MTLIIMTKFSFTLPPTEEAESFELNLSCKDWWVMGIDKLVGSTSINLGPVLNKGWHCPLCRSELCSGSCAVWATLVKREKFDDTGCTILRILSQRATDELAKEFVRLKVHYSVAHLVQSFLRLKHETITADDYLNSTTAL